VGITAGADLMTPTDAILIGLIAGAIIPVAVAFFDRIKIDDPVGATSVHLVCGLWGTLAVGLFGSMAGLKQLWIQFYSTMAIGAFTFGFAFALMYLLKVTIGIRVSEEEEVYGLDVGEHDMHAYAEGMDESPSSFQLAVK
jgi:Amt family ammonium transporter